MAVKGKTIRIYLADGTATGIRHAELVNWTGQALACPRSRIGELVQWSEARRPGVYVLIGFDEEAGRSRAYVGEAENVYDRIQEHVSKKDFWNEVIFFTNKDENLTKAHVKYLESRVLELAQSAGRYLLENANVPQRSALPRGDRDSMEEFLEQAQGLLGVLGHRLLEPLTRAPAGRPEPDLISKDAAAENESLAGMELNLLVSGLAAHAVLTDEGIVVLKGSRASKQVRDSLSAGYRSLRENLIQVGVLRDEGTDLVFTRDQLFSSPSSAAAVIVGYPMNGRKTWRDHSGRTIADMESAD